MAWAERPLNDRRPERGKTDVQQWLLRHPLAIIVVVVLVGAILSEMPWISRGIRVDILRATVVGFFVSVSFFARTQEAVLPALLRGPNPWCIGLVAWCLIEWLHPAHGQVVVGGNLLVLGSALKQYSIGEMIRVVLGVGMFLTVAYAMRPSEVRPVIATVVILGAIVALFAVFRYSSADEHMGVRHEVTGIFGNHEQCGSFILLMLMVPLAFAIERTADTKLSTIAQVLSFAIGGSLLLARTRSCWIGALAGIVILAFLIFRTREKPKKGARFDKSKIVGPFLLLIIGFAVLIFSNQLLPVITHRADSLRLGVEDTSLADRLHRWLTACRMSYESPVWGWGLGSYPLLQWCWSRVGDTPSFVQAHGTGHINIAHNYWVQWASEAGSVGFVLFMGVLIVFVIAACRVALSLPAGFQRTALIGCIATTVAGAFDMIGSPSYQFPGVSTLMWFWMGMAVATMRPVERDKKIVVFKSFPIGAHILALLIAGAFAGSIWFIGSKHPELSITRPVYESVAP